MGKPISSHVEMICASGSHTQGSETSQYLEENKKILISVVAASETEEAQTVLFARRGRGSKGEASNYVRGKLQNSVIAETAGKQCHRR